ncbi:MAG: D-glycero-beta-D-manno-heptose-7-phosphate kinase [Thermodesulfobacteriota bacterium]|nr:D-glycero-beta-D-manno-heptose-7-phosphate kinase [Thermodesulfobacteriota bacterium]
MPLSGQIHKGKILKEHIDRFPRARVLVVGDIIMDEYVWGDVSRISPEAPVPVMDVRRETKMLGGAANVIRNIASLGGRAAGDASGFDSGWPLLCGVIGEDSTGQEITSKIKDIGLTSEGIIIERDRPTSIKTRVVAHGQQIVRIDRESRTDFRPETIQKLLGFVEKNIPKLDAIVVSDYGKGVISTPLMNGLKELVQSASSGSVIIAVDPKTGNFEHYRGVDVITPNHHEAGAFCRFEIEDEQTLIRAGKQMLNELNCGSVLITRGKDGMTLFESSGETTHIRTVAKKVFDVTGAGDTVIGTFSLGLASGLDLKSAAVLSNFAAGIVVGEIGTSSVSADDLKTAIED